MFELCVYAAQLFMHRFSGHLIRTFGASYRYSYHGIENTANQNAGKPLYIRQYSTEPSHRCAIQLYHTHLDTVFSIAWYYATLSRGITVEYPTHHLHFLGIQTRQKA